MQRTEAQDFAAIMAGIAELYDKRLSKSLNHLYWHLLRAYRLEEVKRALQAHLSNPDGGQYFPKPADLIRHLEGGAETRALQAWTVVERAIRQIGSYQSLAFDDPLIHAVIEDMGGWVKLCGIRLKELPFCRLEFQKRYCGCVLRTPRRYPPYLWGVIEEENRNQNHEAPGLYLIGDPEKVRAVIRGGSVRPDLYYLDAQSMIASSALESMHKEVDDA